MGCSGRSDSAGLNYCNSALPALARLTVGTSIEHLYYLPVVISALLFGWRGGLGLGLCAAATLVLIAGQADAGVYLEAIILCVVGAGTGWFLDRERRQKRQYQNVAAKLSSVYEQLQINFEGMKRAERLSAIGHLSAGLAHEIRNPLASISGAASILRRTVSTDPKILRCIEIIEGECRRLNGLLTNFLNFARPRSPQFQTANLNVLLAEVIELAEHAVNRRQILFRKEISEGLTAVDCDPEQLRQVLLNLVINAVEASSEHTTVVLSAESKTIQLSFVSLMKAPALLPKCRQALRSFLHHQRNGDGTWLACCAPDHRATGRQSVGPP